ncbi:YjdF family protein [Gorillibacterium massiliense]|uniref:YjdF family protein n=1 Tax=Gorillibacterium massiliense TaxID=1280390 RepID=UPI0004B99BFA|nr:YjdF family protein [Gorillibacterium massiliense]
MKLTVYHDGQFWVGILEEQLGEKLKAARYVFGAEPRDEEVLQWVRSQMCSLMEGLSQQVEVKAPKTGRISPKRLARQAAEETKKHGVSTFAQAAMKLEYEQRKLEKSAASKEKREEEQERRRLLKVAKAKEKHRGH